VPQPLAVQCGLLGQPHGQQCGVGGPHQGRQAGGWPDELAAHLHHLHGDCDHACR
ncbi:hypothetical protein KR018_003286, partial [Drosophila ironensis]